jgi:hypothetical protein
VGEVREKPFSGTHHPLYGSTALAQSCFEARRLSALRRGTIEENTDLSFSRRVVQPDVPALHADIRVEDRLGHLVAVSSDDLAVGRVESDASPGAKGCVSLGPYRSVDEALKIVVAVIRLLVEPDDKRRLVP